MRLRALARLQPVEELTTADLHARQIELLLAGPACPKNLLARLMQTAHGLLIQEALTRLETQHNERLRDVRLKSRRNRERLTLFAR